MLPSYLRAMRPAAAIVAAVLADGSALADAPVSRCQPPPRLSAPAQLTDEAAKNATLGMTNGIMAAAAAYRRCLDEVVGDADTELDPDVLQALRAERQAVMSALRTDLETWNALYFAYAATAGAEQ